MKMSELPTSVRRKAFATDREQAEAEPLPPVKPRARRGSLTPEERKERHRERCRLYYHANKQKWAPGGPYAERARARKRKGSAA